MYTRKRLKNQFEESNYLAKDSAINVLFGLVCLTVHPRAIKNIEISDRGWNKNITGEERHQGPSVEGKEKHLLADAGQKVQRPNNTLSTDTVEQSGHEIGFEAKMYKQPKTVSSGQAILQNTFL